MDFNKREILLIVGLVFIFIGMLPFLAPIYALAISLVIYFAVKGMTSWKKKKILSEMGKVCADCGSPKTEEGKCNCSENQ